MIVKDPLFANPFPKPLVVSFIAPSSNTGRTSIVTNLAWSLARGGRGVLILDLSTEGADAHEYLGPFAAEESTTEHVLGPLVAELLRGRVEATASATVRHYAVGPARLDIVRTGLSGAECARALRESLPTCPYDYVLVDASTDASAGPLAAIAVLSDRVVVCLSPQSRSVRDAARLTRQVLGQRPGDLPLVLVASHFGGDPEQAERSRGDIDHEFEDFFRGSDPAQLITLPPQFYYDYLATLKEPPGSELLVAYGGLVTALTAPESAGVLPRPLSLSDRYVSSMDHRGATKEARSERRSRPERARERACVVFHPADQQAVEWMTRQLEHNGVDVVPLAVTAEGVTVVDLPVIVVTSRRCPPDALDRLLAARPRDAPLPEVVVVVLPGGRAPAAGPSFAMVDLTDKPTREIAAGRLFGALGMAGVARAAAAERIGAFRRMFASPEYFNAFPAREVPFLGREDEIGALREQLTGAAHQVVVVHGTSGIGKTALVREYIERFSSDYDTVWWIPAHTVRAVRGALSLLGQRLAVRPRGDMVAATLDLLAADTPPRGISSPGRWLLVFDGLDHPADLDGLVPSGGGGHVVITAKVDLTAADLPGQILRLGPLEHKDAVDGLATLVDEATDHTVSLTQEQADSLVQAAGRTPIGIRLTSVYLVRRLAESQARTDPTGAEEPLQRMLTESVATLVGAVTAVAAEERLGSLLQLVLDLLQRDPYGRRARHLAEMCGFLAPDGTDLRMLRAPALLAQLTRAGIDADRPANDDQDHDAGEVTADDIDRIIWTGATFGFFSVKWQLPEPLRVVPALQRLLLDRLPPRHREERRDQVRRGLAAVAIALPWEADTRMPSPEAEWTAAIYGELQRHLLACDALDAVDTDVREWVLRQFRHLIRTADQANLRYAEPLVTALLERWRREQPTGLLTLRLANELTNIQRGLGHYRQALELDQAMLDTFVPRLGRDHFRALVLRRGLAADRRALGEFEPALALDQATWQLFHDTHGVEHPETLTTGHNLAVSQFLAGQVAVALVTEQQVYEGRRRLLGPKGRQTLWSEMEIGIYTRELGEFEQAAGLLQTVEQRMQEAGWPRTHTLRLRARRHWAIAQRLAGDAAASRDTTQQILHAYEDLFGPDHPSSWATRLSVAAEAHATGDFARAAGLASDVLVHYESDLGESHPFTAAARANLAVYLQHAGRHADAATQSRRAYADLFRTLRDSHPWTITALLGWVLTEAEQQNQAVAARLAHNAYSLSLEFLPRNHPCLLVATDWWEDLRDDRSVTVLLGQAANRRRYVDITIPET